MRRGAIVGIVAGAVALVAAAGVTWWLLSRPPSAEDAARTYLEALEAGDYEAIQGMRERLLPGAEEAILAESFASAAEYLSDTAIDDLSEQSDGIVGVRASGELDGEQQTVYFALGRADDGRFLLAGDYLATATVDARIAGTPLPAVWIGDALAPTSTAVDLLPARYDVAVAPRGILVGASELPLDNEEPATVVIEASLSPDATARAQEQLDAYAAMCTAPASAVPDHCGIVVPWAADLATLEQITFRIEQPPVVVLADDASGFEATSGVLVATATGSTHDGAAGTFTYRTDEWALRGSIRFDGDEMVLLVR